MKNLILISIIIAVFSFSACGRKENAPETVKTAFAKKFPTAKKIKWDKENATEWEAEVKMNGKEFSANFASDGTWMETEYEIKKKEIPAAVKQTLDSEFAGYWIEEAELSETAEGQVFEFELEKDDIEMEVAISPDGTVVKTEVKEKHDEEDGEEDND